MISADISSMILMRSPLISTHQIIIVAASLDDSTERIVKYLSAQDIPITSYSSKFLVSGMSNYLVVRGFSIPFTPKLAPQLHLANPMSLGM
jgi:hypothetical protein